MVNPYTDNGDVRTFENNVLNEELVWHRDHNDREVVALEGTGWKIQYDNKLPQLIEVGKPFFIKAYEYHRLHKGSDTLKLKIKEMI